MGNVYFFVLLIISMLFLMFADKKNNKLFLVIGILIISLVAGLRGINVGIDTVSYYTAFVNNFPKSWQFEEVGFRYISMFLMKIFCNPSVIFCVYALVTNFLIILRLWDFRKKCNFGVMIFLYLTIFFLDSMNIMRQFIALSIIFYSTRFLEKKNYLLFFIITLLMTFIHKSSLLALLLIVIYMWNGLTKKQKIIFIMPIVILLFIGINYVLKFESGHINNYFSLDNSVNNINITFMYRVAIFFFSFLLFKSQKKIVLKKSNLGLQNKNEFDVLSKMEFRIISCIYFFGLCFASMGMFYFVMSRIGYYYLIFELIYWGYISKNSKNNFLNFSLIAIYAVYILSIEILRNGSGIFPYYFNL